MQDITGQVSIIIVTHNSLPALKTCLQHLQIAAQNIPHEIIIVDNNSNDNSPSFVKNICPKAKQILNRKNKGFAAACNTGSTKAEGTLLLFLNPDLFLDEFAIINLLKNYAALERPGVSVGRLRTPDGKFQPTCRELPTISNIIFSRRGLLGSFLEKSRKYTHPEYDDVTSVPAAAGTFMLVSKKLFNKIGRFDERFFMYMEDTDLCKRLIMAGFKNYFIPAAGGVHDWGKGSQAGMIRRSLLHHLSVYKYFVKHRQDWLARLIFPLPLLANFVMVSLIEILKKPFGR